MTIRVNSLLAMFLILAMVTDYVQWHDLLGSYDLRLWQLVVLLIACVLVVTRRFAVPKLILPIAILLFFVSSTASLIGGTGAVAGAVQVFLFTGLYCTIYGLVRTLGPRTLKRSFLAAASIVAGSIILEQLIYFVSPSSNPLYLYDFTRKYDEMGIILRGHGLMREPSQVALILPPALFICLWERRTRTAALCLFASILTFSTLTYIGLGVAVLVRGYIRGSRRFAIIAAACILLIPSLYLVPPVQARIEALVNSIDILANWDVLYATDIHRALGGSVGALAVNMKVAFTSLYETSGFGVGLGNFAVAFDRYMTVNGVTAEEARNMDILFSNTDTSGSIVLRLTAELGLIGLITIPILLARHFQLIQKVKTASIRGLKVASDEYQSVLILICAFSVLFFTYCLRKDGYINLFLILSLATVHYLSIRYRAHISIHRHAQPMNPRLGHDISLKSQP